MNQDCIVRMKAAQPRILGMNFPRGVDWEIKEGEQWCVLGKNGSGKTLLADLLSGRYAVGKGEINYLFWDDNVKQKYAWSYPTEAIKKVSFESAYLLSDYRSMYYQQRFHALENEITPTVEELLMEVKEDESYLAWLCEKLHLDVLLSKRLIMLSSGELRRLLIFLALISHPKLVIFDNPFIGLDVQMREELEDFFEELAAFQNMIFLVPAKNEIPRVANRFLLAEELHFREIDTPEEFQEERANLNFRAKLPIPLWEDKVESDYLFRMKNINVSYKDIKVFSNLTWEVRRGEKWALLGRNGSGKSTLLSLLAADNPKGYALDLEIFGRKRGSGESIWDIKKHIGYISSEMHLYFREDQPCLKIVASGLFDTIGLFRSCNEEQNELAIKWMKLLSIDYLKDRSFLKISGGEQRLVLLARTMVKNPNLLILDEPLHGLDIYHKSLARMLIEQYSEQSGKSLIYVTHKREEIPNCVGKVFELQNSEKYNQ